MTDATGFKPYRPPTPAPTFRTQKTCKESLLTVSYANISYATELGNMLIDQTARGIGFLLTDVSHLLRKVIDRRLQPQGLTRAQWAVLASLAKAEGVTQSQLADQLEIEKSTAGRLIDHMEHNGWVERRPIPGDRRSRGVHLTDKARPLIARIEEIILKTREESVRGLTDDEQRVLSAAVETMKTNLRAILDEDR